MPSEALSDGIFIVCAVLCRDGNVGGAALLCRHLGFQTASGASDGIGGFGRHRGFGGLKPTLQYCRQAVWKQK
ncbi:hypothetical protein [Neisseria lactamica]|uniref:hypothetical protein n=1 Tax=Neisseria lactamica TaxID=486 RepID=UPI00117C3376|nr:hypothetical protein [Neisseria lactamica]